MISRHAQGCLRETRDQSRRRQYREFVHCIRDCKSPRTSHPAHSGTRPRPFSFTALQCYADEAQAPLRTNICGGTASLTYAQES
jgi:hypothetical protein